MKKGDMFQVLVKLYISHIMPSLVVPSCLAGAQFFSKARVHDEKYILDILRNSRITFLQNQNKIHFITQNDDIIKYVLS